MPPSQLILWSQGRTACHLLERMLSNQPNTKLLWHPMAPARPPQVEFMNESGKGPQSDLHVVARRQYVDAVNAGIDAWEQAWEESQRENKMLFIHEHPQFAASPDDAIEWVSHDWKSAGPHRITNFTMIPDGLLLKPTTSAIVTIRHPAWIVPAAFRAMKGVEGSDTRSNLILVCGLHWQRQIYDWCTENGVRAVIVEAEDYMTSPNLVKKLCEEVGLDPERALFSWPRATEEEKAKMHPRVVQLLHTLLHSTGLIPGKATAPPDLPSEEVKWREEFDEERATLIKELVQAAMPDYEYLEARKLTL